MWTRATARAEFFRYKSRFNIKKRYNRSMKPKEIITEINKIEIDIVDFISSYRSE